MSKKIEKLVKKLSDSEQKELQEYIERHYEVNFIGEVMRDDIRDKLIEVIHAEHTHLDKLEIYEEHDLKKHLSLDAAEVTSIAVELESEFEIEEIPFARVMEWTLVKDIVDYLETALEESIND